MLLLLHTIFHMFFSSFFGTLFILSTLIYSNISICLFELVAWLPRKEMGKMGKNTVAEQSDMKLQHLQSLQFHEWLSFQNSNRIFCVSYMVSGIYAFFFLVLTKCHIVTAITTFSSFLFSALFYRYFLSFFRIFIIFLSNKNKQTMHLRRAGREGEHSRFR